MTRFRKYPKLHRLGKDETLGILNGLCVIQEKIDGANASIWMQDGEIRCGSRNNDLIERGNPFNGFVEYVKNHRGVRSYLEKNPTHTLYGEWLVKHTLNYDYTKYKEFYLFDIYDNELDVNAHSDYVKDVAINNDIKFAQVFGVFENPTQEQIMEFVGKSCLGDKGEGVVIKNKDFELTLR